MLTQLINLISALVIAILPKKVWVVIHGPEIRDTDVGGVVETRLIGLFRTKEEAFRFARRQTESYFPHGYKEGFIRDDGSWSVDRGDMWIIHNLDESYQDGHLAMMIRDWDFQQKHMRIKYVDSVEVVPHFLKGLTETYNRT